MEWTQDSTHTKIPTDTHRYLQPTAAERRLLLLPLLLMTDYNTQPPTSTSTFTPLPDSRQAEKKNEGSRKIGDGLWVDSNQRHRKSHR